MREICMLRARRRELEPDGSRAALRQLSTLPQAESFFSRYKAELLENGVFESVEQARSETFSYIEGYYNRVRRHSSLGYKTPDEFEREWHINNKTKETSSERVVSSKT